MAPQVFMAAVIFFAIYHILKNLTDYLLKRRLIKENQVDKAEALQQFAPSDSGKSNYPTLKWGLVALFAGLGFILIEILRMNKNFAYDLHNSFLTPGIILVFTAAGFLTYFFIAKNKDKE